MCVHDDSWNLMVNDSFKEWYIHMQFKYILYKICEEITVYTKRSCSGWKRACIISEEVIGCWDIGVGQHWLVAYKGKSGRCFCGSGVRLAGPWRISVLTSVKHKAHVNIMSQIRMGVIHITITKRTVFISTRPAFDSACKYNHP